MLAEKSEKRLFEKRELIYIGILAAIALGLGIYQIATTVMIAQDGVRYINNAKMFGNDFTAAFRRYWPGYPFLIFLLHNFINLFHKTDSIYSWIYCGQAVSLLCRVLSLIPMYFIGKILVGERKTLWGLLILILLPYPAEFGVDVIREWPHIFFLAAGMALLIYGARKGSWWMFGLAGLVAGLGHTVRPECAQVVIYGMLWLIICLIIPRPEPGRGKAVLLIFVLLAGFAIPVGPFMKIRNEIVPGKLNRVIGQFSNDVSTSPDNKEIKVGCDNEIMCRAESVPADIVRAAGRLVQAISEDLMHFFILPFVIGVYWGFRKIRKAIFDEKFFILCLLSLYTIMMTLLHINYDYISRRHCLPMVILGIFYVPIGLELIAGWVEVNVFRNKKVEAKDIQSVFLILLCIGLIICVGKIGRITPLRAEKQSHLQAAKWLKENTKQGDKIAVFDGRIELYSARKCLVVQENSFPEGMDYIVRQFEGQAALPDGWDVQKKFAECQDKVAIYGKP